MAFFAQLSLSVGLIFFSTCLPLLYSPSCFFFFFFFTTLRLFYSFSCFFFVFFSQVSLYFLLLLHFRCFFFPHVPLSFILTLHFPFFFGTRLPPLYSPFPFRFIFFLSPSLLFSFSVSFCCVAQFSLSFIPPLPFIFFFPQVSCSFICPLRYFFLAKGTVRGLLYALIAVKTEILPPGRHKAKLSLSHAVRCEFIECNC